ncbi:hypothetical protein [Hydrogenimonas urashimensis]|uniref:hypothetical protein n=1 Tax=Hydrogenimonas urashimensis TaxID=2740515 RepID=UPI0019153EDF|nr:hypothetical protein [Hydrogenimonas urashimensis]
MRRLLLLAVWLSGAFCMPPLPGLADIYLNKPDVRLKEVPVSRLERLRKSLGLEEIRIEKNMGIVHIVLKQKVKERIDRIATAVDLRPWFTDKACAKNWESFHRCMNEKRNGADEALYRRLDREFVSKILCEEGNPCENPDFVKWELHWRAPWYITLQAPIGGDGAFESVADAKKSLGAVNALLKKVLYGARFPENYGEGRSEYEIYTENSVRIVPRDFGPKAVKLLTKLEKAHYLKGISDRDIGTIGKLTAGGKTVFYLPPRCPAAKAVPECAEAQRLGGGFKPGSWCAEATKPGWHATSNGNALRFDRHRCPHIEVLR